VGLAGIFRNRLSKKWALFFGSIFGLFLCYFFHTLSGTIFYGAWAEWFFLESAAKDFAVSAWVMNTFTGTGLSLAYSIIYNGLYMIPEIVLTAIASLAISKIPSIKKG
jgi:thiamine transporter